MMKLFQNIDTGKFPCYQAEVDKFNATRNAIIRKGGNPGSGYREVIDQTASFDPDTERLGAWSEPAPGTVDGVATYVASREVLTIPLSEREVKLQTARREALERIDTLAGNARVTIGSRGEYQEAEYQLKGEQALAFLADPTLTEEEVPMIFANVGTSDGETPQAVAETYAAMRATWMTLIADISSVRRVAKDAVIAATSRSEIRSVMADLTF